MREKHNEVVAHQFYLMGIEVKIATWDESLPNGFDVKDDKKANGIFDETDKAIVNAVLYEPTKTEIDNNLKISHYGIKGYEVLKSNQQNGMLKAFYQKALIV